MIALNKIGQGAASCLLGAACSSPSGAVAAAVAGKQAAITGNFLALKASAAINAGGGRQASSSASLFQVRHAAKPATAYSSNSSANLNARRYISSSCPTATLATATSSSSSSSSSSSQETTRTPIISGNKNAKTTTVSAVCYSDYETLQVSSPINRVLHIQLNRPDKRNALNRQALQELQSVFRTIHEDTHCRAVVISGEGKDFSSGLDHQDIEKILHEISSTQGITVNRDVARRAKFLRNLLSKYQETFSMVERCAKPVIASVHGACLGAALNLICCADVRFCAQDSFFQLKDVSAGMMADMGVLQRMPKMVANDSWIRELALTARRASSGEAKENGLVSRLYENQQQALQGALDMAASITNNSPVAVQGTKLCMNYSRDHSTHDGLVWALNWNMGMLQSEDLLKAMEGVGRTHEVPEFDDL